MDDLTAADERMRATLRALERDLERVRAGAASASMLEAIHVDHHGRRTRLLDMATVTIPDPRQIVIQPWDPSALRAIGAAISASRTGLTPTVDGPRIRLYIPGVTEERRRELVAVVQERVERARIDLRAVRHAALGTIRAAQHDHAIGADEARRRTTALGAMTDRAIAEADRLGVAAEARLLHV